MLNRRFLRVKALQSIYAYHQSESSNLPQAERQLLDWHRAGLQRDVEIAAGKPP